MFSNVDHMNTSAVTQELLVTGDPAPVEWVNRDSDAKIALLCEHAGRAIPQKLGDLGVSEVNDTTERVIRLVCEGYADDELVGASAMGQQGCQIALGS